MPTPLMKSLAKEANKKPKTVEKLWAKAEKIVKKKYDIDDSSSRYWPLVVGVTKNILGLAKEIKEDGEITTTNMGSNNGQGAVFADRLGTPQKRVLHGDILPVEKETKVKKSKDYDKLVKKIVKKVNEKALKESLDDIMSDALEYYSTKFKNPEDIFENAISNISKRLGLKEDIFS